MIKKLQKKFIAICMTSIFLVLLSVFIVLNAYLNVKSYRQTSEALDSKLEKYAAGIMFPGLPEVPAHRQDSDTGIAPSDPGKRGNEAGMKFFFAALSADGTVSRLDISGMPDITAEDAETFIERVFSADEEQGIKESFQYRVKATADGFNIIVGDRSVADSMLTELFWTSLAVLAAACCVFFVAVLLLSKQAISPVREAYMKQQQFLADAGHELKTPIAIIKADADVLANQTGGSKWLDGIQEQCNRLSELIHDMISLAKTEELPQSSFRDFDLSALLTGTALEFESAAYESGKSLKCEIPEGIAMCGDENGIRQLSHILIDNAIKHSGEKATVTVSLSCHGTKRRIRVTNTDSVLSDDDRNRIFERFYRSDTSRSRNTGGYGLGLSIAKAIVSAHDGRISASCRNGTVCFETVI